MKEEVAKNLIKKSTIHTSADFTGRLLLKIETEEANKRPLILLKPRNFVNTIYGLSVIATVFFILWYNGFYPKFFLGYFYITLNKTPFLVLTTFFLLMGINYILRLRENVIFHKEITG